MSYDNDVVRIIWLLAALAAAVASIASQRLSLSFVVRAALGWAAIILATVFVVAHRHEIAGTFASISNTLGLSEQQVHGSSIRIRMSPDGHFWATVSLNGVERNMLVDSGATTTSLSEATAAAAGISTGDDGFPVLVGTANGTVTAKRGRVARLEIGPITTTDLGVVVSPNFGDMDVLGMNFLSRLKSWRVEGSYLVLDPGDGSAPIAAE